MIILMSSHLWSIIKRISKVQLVLENPNSKFEWKSIKEVLVIMDSVLFDDYFPRKCIIEDTKSVQKSNSIKKISALLNFHRCLRIL